ELREVISARIAQRIRYYRQFRQKRLAGLDLAVQNPQRVCLETLLTTSAKVRKYFTNGFFQLRDVRRSTVLVSDRIHQKLGAGYAQLFQIPVEHLDDFCFDSRVIALTEHFDPDLSELPIAALLRSLATKLRTDIIKFYKPRLIEQTVLDVRAHR